MIVDFKAQLFCAATGLSRREIDPSDPLWRDRINAYFDNRQGLPATGSTDEYAAAFEAVHPAAPDRRAYIANAVNRGVPSFGHRVIGALVASRLVPAMFTTNFDQLLERSATVANDLLPSEQQSHLAVAALHSVEVAQRSLRDNDWPLLVKLHGDYQSDALKNTSVELRHQDEQLRNVLIEISQRFGLIVAGYSGRDDSIMDALTDALGGPTPFPSGVTWLVRPGTTMFPTVTRFLQAAERAGVTVQIVEFETFDEFAADLYGQLQLADSLDALIRSNRPAPLLTPVELPTLDAGPVPVLRLSALPVLSMPTTARRIQLTKPVTLDDARNTLKDAHVQASIATRGTEVIAFGRDVALLDGLAEYGPTLDGTVAIDPAADSWALGLVYDALVKALTRHRPLRPVLRNRGHAIVTRTLNTSMSAEVVHADTEMLATLRKAYAETLHGVIPGTQRSFAEGLRIRFEVHAGRWWCVFDPYTWVAPLPEEQTGETEGPRRRTTDTTVTWRKERWARRYNGKWDSILEAWSKTLVPPEDGTICAFGVSDGDGIDAVFKLSPMTAWARSSGTQVL